jgi:hypothetical protein
MEELCSLLPYFFYHTSFTWMTAIATPPPPFSLPLSPAAAQVVFTTIPGRSSGNIQVFLTTETIVFSGIRLLLIVGLNQQWSDYC